MKDSLILSFCRKQGIHLKLSWRSHCNCVRFHNKNETTKHFLYKAGVAFELMKRGQTVFTEFEFAYGKRTGVVEKRMCFPVADLVWLDEKIIVEFESHPTEEILKLKYEQFKDFNVFVFDISKVSIKEILEKIGVGKSNGFFVALAGDRGMPGIVDVKQK